MAASSHVAPSQPGDVCVPRRRARCGSGVADGSVCGVIEWVVAPLAVVLAFWLPGVLVLKLGGARLHGIDLAAVAPAVTIGMCAITAEAIRPLGVRWGPPAALVATLVGAAIALVLRARAGRTARPPLRRDRPALVAAAAVAVVLQVAVVMEGIGDPRRLLAANDVGAHMTLLRGVVQTGQASALTLTGAGELDGVARAFYPAGWHAVAALAVPAGGLAATFTWAWLLPSAVAWTCGVVALTRAAFPQRPAILPWAALITGPGVALPLTLTLTPEGMVPNAVGAALVPGVLAVMVRRRAVCGSAAGRVLLAAVGLVGLAALHPNTFLAAALLGAGWWLPSVVRRARRRWSAGGRTRAALVAFSALAVVVLGVAGVVAAHNAEVRFIFTTHDEGALPIASAAWGLVTLDATFMTVGSGFILTIAAIVGAVLVWRRRGRPMATGAIVMALFFLAASSSVPVLASLDAPWYDESRRYAPVIVAGALPLAAYGAHAGCRYIASRMRRDARSLMRVAVPALALLGVLVPGVLDLSHLASLTSTGAYQGTPIADDSELALLARLPGELSGGALLSGPFSGGSDLYALSGYPTVPRDASTTVTPELRDVVTRLAHLGTDPRACADLDALGVRYLYVDPAPWQGWSQIPIDGALSRVPSSAVRLVDQSGSVRVYEVTACG
jgi:hypothetical protein